MTDAQDSIRDILKKAYQIEVDGYTFYSMAADRAEKPAVQDLFDKLAKDEVEHKAYLTSVMRSYDEKGPAAFLVDRRPTPDLRAFSDRIFTDKFKEQAKGAAFEMGVLSIGMTLEQNAIQYFTRASKETGESEIRDFYDFLAAWEKQHFDALQNLYQGVRQEFWAEGGFAPF
jgi:rubrerythrin